MSFGEEARLTIHPLCGYPSFDPGEFRDDDWKARYLVKAVKHDTEALSRSFVWMGKPPKKFNHENYQELVAAFHRWAAAKLKELAIAQPVLIAAPNSSAIVGSDADYPTKLAVEGIAEAYGEGCAPFTDVRFTHALPKAHQGGSRNKYEILEHLALTQPLPAGTPVLFDDVCSSGAHLFAVQKLIAPREVGLAIVCGRTVQVPHASMLKMPAEEIVTYW